MIGDLTAEALRPALWRPLTLVPKAPDVPRSSALSPASPTSALYLPPPHLLESTIFSKIDSRSVATVTRSTLGKRKREASDF
jgi:hypothetical protein